MVEVLRRALEPQEIHGPRGNQVTDLPFCLTRYRDLFAVHRDCSPSVMTGKT